MIRKTLFLLLFTLTLSSEAASHAAPVHPQPQRIVSLTPAITEMLFALGLGPEVVGDTLYCNYPPAAQRIPKIGAVHVNYEQVVALRPTLIIGDQIATPEADARLSQLHFRVLSIHPASITLVEQSLLQIGQAAGRQAQARKVVARMQAVRQEAHRIALHSGFRPSVLMVIGTNPLYVAGQGTFMNDILLEAGGVNAVSLSGYATLSKEVLLAHPPTIILADPQDQAALKADPVLRLLPAVHNNRFVFISSDLLQRPGPRIVQGLLLLAHALHPVRQ